MLGGAQVLPKSLAADTSKELFDQGAGMGIVMAGYACAASTMTAWAQTQECRDYLDYFEQVCAARELMHAKICSSLRKANMAIQKMARAKQHHKQHFSAVLQQLGGDGDGAAAMAKVKPAGWVLC